MLRNKMKQLEAISSKIYEIRGLRVMLDRDLAAMYGVETRTLNQSVKRNIERFPSDFMFQLSREEWESLKSQIVTSNRGGVRKMPYAFTEMGVAMLSSVLASPTAIQINIGIMRAFVTVRQSLTSPTADNYGQLQKDVRKLKEYLEDVLTDQNEINEDTSMRLELIEQSLAELQPPQPRKNIERPKIGFNI